MMAEAALNLTPVAEPRTWAPGIPETAVALEGVTVGYEAGKPILHNLDLQIERGACVAVVGPSGSGKTTLLRVVLGLLRPSVGRVVRRGPAAAETGREQPMSIGYIPQNLGLVRHASVRHNVLLGALNRMPWWRALWSGFRPEDVRAADEALAWVGLGGRGDEPVTQLSGGEQRRVAVARALLQQPDLLVADEFLAELDAVNASQMIRLIRDLREQTGLTMLFVDHDLDMACELADRVVVLSEGRKSAELEAEQACPISVRSLFN